MKKLATLSLLALSLSACTQLQQSTERLPETSIIKKVVNAFSDNHKVSNNNEITKSSMQKPIEFNSLYEYVVAVSNGMKPENIAVQKFKTRGKQTEYGAGYIETNYDSLNEKNAIVFLHSHNFNNDDNFQARLNDLKLNKVKFIRKINFATPDSDKIICRNVDPYGVRVAAVYFYGVYEVLVENKKIYIVHNGTGGNHSNDVWTFIDSNKKISCETVNTYITM